MSLIQLSQNGPSPQYETPQGMHLPTDLAGNRRDRGIELMYNLKRLGKNVVEIS